MSYMLVLFHHKDAKAALTLNEAYVLALFRDSFNSWLNLPDIHSGLPLLCAEPIDAALGVLVEKGFIKKVYKDRYALQYSN